MHEFKSRLQHLVSKYFYNFKPYKVLSPIFKRQDIAALRELPKNEKIVVCSPDKGRGVVLLDRTVYNEKKLELISDQIKFYEIRESITTYLLRIEDKI